MTIEPSNCGLVGPPPTTPSGQPLIPICGPANELPGNDIPVPDVCLPMGQMSQSLMPCDVTTGEIIWNDTISLANDNHWTAVPTNSPTLPETGGEILPTMIFGSFAILLGMVLRWTARRHEAKSAAQAFSCPTTGPDHLVW